MNFYEELAPYMSPKAKPPYLTREQERRLSKIIQDSRTNLVELVSQTTTGAKKIIENIEYTMQNNQSTAAALFSFDRSDIHSSMHT